jgi:hypothetical protein
MRDVWARTSARDCRPIAVHGLPNLILSLGNFAKSYHANCNSRLGRFRGRGGRSLQQRSLQNVVQRIWIQIHENLRRATQAQLVRDDVAHNVRG